MSITPDDSGPPTFDPAGVCDYHLHWHGQLSCDCRGFRSSQTNACPPPCHAHRDEHHPSCPNGPRDSSQDPASYGSVTETEQSAPSSYPDPVKPPKADKGSRDA